MDYWNGSVGKQCCIPEAAFPVVAILCVVVPCTVEPWCDKKMVLHLRRLEYNHETVVQS